MLKEIITKSRKDVKCKKCDGTLHSIAPIYDIDNPLMTRYKCKCNKCGNEIVLDFDPDQK